MHAAENNFHVGEKPFGVLRDTQHPLISSRQSGEGQNIGTLPLDSRHHILAVIKTTGKKRNVQVGAIVKKRRAKRKTDFVPALFRDGRK